MVIHGHWCVANGIVIMVIVIIVRILKGYAKNNSKYETVKQPSKNFDIQYDFALVLIGCKLLVLGMIIEKCNDCE